jgi:TRAP-type transport system small permease protein
VTEGPPDSGRPDPVLYIGGGALLFAMAVDVSAVVGRHLGVTLRGSIELVRAAILVASSCAVVLATQAGRHAKVHLLLQRLRQREQTIVRLLGNALGIVFFMLLAAGGTWIAGDLWHGHEESELLHIPYAPLRVIAIGAMLGAAAVLLIQRLGAKRS